MAQGRDSRGRFTGGGGRGASLGSATLYLNADPVQLNKALGQVNRDFKNQFGNIVDLSRRWGAAITLAAGASVAAMGGVIHSFVATGSSLLEMHQRTGIAVETLSGLGYAADQTGTSLEAIEKAVKKVQVGITAGMDKSADSTERFQEKVLKTRERIADLQAKLGDIRDPEKYQKALTDIADAQEELNNLLSEGPEGKGFVEALDHIGLKVENLKNLKPEDQFLTIAKHIAQIPDPTERAARAIQIFGKSGTDLLPLLSEDIDGLMRRAKELGLIWDIEMAQKAEKFGDTMNDLKQAGMGLTIALGPHLVDAVEGFTKSAIEAVSSIRAWVSEHPELTKWLVETAVKLTALGLVLGPFLRLVPGVIMTFKSLGVVIKFIQWAKAARDAKLAADAIGGIGGAAKGGFAGLGILQAGILAFTTAAMINELVKLYSALIDVIEAQEQLKSSEQRMVDQIHELEAVLQAAGVAYDADALRKMSAMEALDTLRGVYRENIAAIRAHRDATQGDAEATGAANQQFQNGAGAISGHTGALWGNDAAARTLAAAQFGLADGMAIQSQAAYAAGDANYYGANAANVNAEALAYAMSKGGEFSSQMQILEDYLRQNGVAFDETSLRGKSMGETLDYLRELVVNASEGVGVNTQAAEQAAQTYAQWDPRLVSVNSGLLGVANNSDSASEGMYEQAAAAEYGTGANVNFANATYGTGGSLYYTGNAAWYAANGLAAYNAQLGGGGGGGGYANGGVVGYANGGVIPGYAAGGMVKGHRIVKVGERGEEVAAFPVGTRILSNRDLKNAIAAGQAMSTRRMARMQYRTQLGMSSSGISGGGDTFSNTVHVHVGSFHGTEENMDRLVDKIEGTLAKKQGAGVRRAQRARGLAPLGR